MTRDEILAAMVKVAEALERPGLKPEQIARGRAKYEQLETELAFITNKERKESEQNPPSYNYEPKVQEHVDKVWSILDPDGKRRRKK